MNFDCLSDAQMKKLKERYDRDGKIPITICLTGIGSDRQQLADCIRRLSGMGLDEAGSLLNSVPTEFDVAIDPEDSGMIMGLIERIVEMDGLGASGRCDMLEITFGGGVYQSGKLYVPHVDSTGSSAAAPSVSASGSSAGSGGGCLWVIIGAILTISSVVYIFDKLSEKAEGNYLAIVILALAGIAMVIRGFKKM